MYLNRGPFKFHLKSKFSKVFKYNLFFGSESLSGGGSDLDQTRVIRQKLPTILRELKINSILDVPCGDFNWMSKVDLTGIRYTGSDVVPELIAHLRDKFGNEQRDFHELNVVNNIPRKYDAIFCRDLFVHLNNQEIKASIKNFSKSNSQYLITTTFTSLNKNSDLPLFTRSVAWRPLNLTLSPFSFPPPIALINEECTEYNGGFSDKSLGIWKISDLDSTNY
jgi:hypothetical protein